MKRKTARLGDTGRRGTHEASKKISGGEAGGSAFWRIRPFGQTKPTTGAANTGAGGTSDLPLLRESGRGDARRKNLLGNERGKISRHGLRLSSSAKTALFNVSN